MTDWSQSSIPFNRWGGQAGGGANPSKAGGGSDAARTRGRRTPCHLKSPIGTVWAGSASPSGCRMRLMANRMRRGRCGMRSCACVGPGRRGVEVADAGAGAPGRHGRRSQGRRSHTPPDAGRRRRRASH